MSQEATVSTAGEVEPVVRRDAAEEAELQAVLERLDETGERIAQRLGRIHGLMRDIGGELQMARGIA